MAKAAKKKKPMGRPRIHPLPPPGFVPAPVGRPSDYLPEYCERVIEFCAKGFSLTAFAGEINSSRGAIDRWMNTFPEFREACKTALSKRAQFLESGMMDPTATGPMVTARRFALVNAHLKAEPRDWSENTRTELTGANGGPIQTVNFNLDVNNMPAEALDNLEKALMAMEGNLTEESDDDN